MERVLDSRRNQGILVWLPQDETTTRLRLCTKTPEHSSVNMGWMLATDHAAEQFVSNIAQYSEMKIRTSSRSGVTTILENDLVRKKYLREDATVAIPRRMSSSVNGRNVIGMDAATAMQPGLPRREDLPSVECSW
eukprot:4954294-Amphidinium_carterae.1